MAAAKKQPAPRGCAMSARDESLPGPDDARAILDALAHQDPLRLRYRDDDEFHDECMYCEAEPSAGEEHDPERCLHLRARAIVASVPRGDYATGWREGEHAAGRRAGQEMGRRFRRQQEVQERAAADEDRRRRGKLSGELGSSAVLSWEELTRRIAELHRERYHFEALARDAGSREEVLKGRVEDLEREAFEAALGEDL